MYGCDITYGTNNEFGFDYLRDNMKPTKEYQAQGELNYAIIDEVDSILIDEAYSADHLRPGVRRRDEVCRGRPDRPALKKRRPLRDQGKRAHLPYER